MRLTKHESEATAFTLQAAEAKADEFNERHNPHLTGELARVLVDQTKWPDHKRYCVGIFNAQNVRVGLLCAITTLAILSGCARYCSGRPHYHQGAAEAAPVFCTTDRDCELQTGREY